MASIPGTKTEALAMNGHASSGNEVERELGGKTTVSDSDISTLRNLLSKIDAQVLAPSDDGYDKSCQRWSRAAEKPAGVAIVPTTAEGVAITLKYATEQGLDIAVKGGGHSTAGASSTQGGILIDLSRMRNVRVDLASQRLHVQGGANWGDVDAAAWEHGLATVGGTVADTGVGGLTLGGGYGYLSGERGLVIDNMVGATVVLANGDVKHASKDENPDLFWALRGAGQNFGVTTEFVLQAFPQGDVFMGTLVFPPLAEVVKKLVELVNDLYTLQETTSGPSTNIAGKGMSLLGIAHNQGRTGILLVLMYNGPEHEARKIYKPFFDLNPVHDDTRMGSYPAVNNLVPTEIGRRSSMKGAAFVLPIREAFVMDMLGLYDQFLTSCPDAGMSLVAWELLDPTKIVASEEGCFANRGYHLNSVIMPVWNDQKDDKACRQWARDMSLRFKEEIEAHGQQSSDGFEGSVSVRGHKGAVMLYGNYDQYDERSRDIFGEHYPRLQQIKAKYDPHNFFNKLFAITPQA